MKALSLALVFALAGTTAGCASPFDGSWQKKYPSTGPESDVFTLDIWSNGNQLCATHQATAHLGMRVDEDEDNVPSVKGKVKGSAASVDYISRSWGGSGSANIAIQNGQIHWHVIDQTGESWIPDDAVLTRVRNAHAAPTNAPLCTSDKLE
jgi:hypothetical protein